MSDGEVRTERRGDVVHVTFDRQAARNAMTWQMYEALGETCEKLRSDASVRAVVFRGAGGKSFIAGTDIAQFKTFTSGEDGVAYEEKMERYPLWHRRSADADAVRDRGLRDRRRARHRRVLRSADRHAGKPVRRADRAHARQLPLGRELRADGRGAGHGRAPRRCCCWPRISPPRRRWPAASWSRSCSPQTSTSAWRSSRIGSCITRRSRCA